MKINIEIQSSPNEFDIAFVSIDKNGTQGRLNKFVLKEFDLKLDNLPASDQLSNGSAHWRDSKRKKELIYIVTVGDGDTKLLLDENFSSALSQYSETWSNKRVWIPLMGTGTGGLDFRTSFTIISNAINKFIDKQNLPDEIVIALPLETDKKIIEWLVKQIALLEDNFKKDTQELNKTQELLGNLLNQKINFYVASHIWDEGDQMSRFLKESIWENHSENEYIYAINKVKKGDVVFLKSISSVNLFQIRCLGVVSNNPKNGRSFHVNWYPITLVNIPISDKSLDSIYQIDPESLNRIFKRLYERRADIFEIIKKLSKQKKQIIDTEFFSEKHKHIIDSSEFYFQKARDVLEQLKNYWSLSGPLNDTVKDENVPLAFPYQELDSYWKEKGKVTPAKFIELLKKEQPELIPLYELIGKFLSYVDRRSWNRQNFNEYEDKRYIAESGVFYGDLVSHFLQYAINDFKLLPEKSNNIFNRVIEYLQEPQLKFNILSPRHQELISSYFLIVNFTGEEFHRRLLQYFEKFELSTVNAENRTCLYSAILYDFEIKKLWDKEGKTDTVEEEPEISEPETGVIKTSLDNDGAFAPKDLLDIENDVRSFALVLASKEVKPPLAVALFGKWGSGKSFFMEQLSKRVDELSINQGFLEEGETTPTQDEEKEPDAFCKGIAQIKFNAWSYMDANLLAGLVSSIFEKLDEYITDRTKSGVAKLKVQEKLGERLKALRALIETEEGKKIRLELLKKGYQQESLKLEKNIVQNLGKEILEISNADDELQKTFEDLSLNEEQFGKNFTINGVKLISEYKYWANFIKNLKKAPQLFTFLLFAIIGIGIAYSLVHFTQINISFLYSSPLVLPLIKALSWWKGKQINIKKYVNQFNTVIEANSDIKDKVTQLESKIKFANEQKEKAQEKIQELEIKIQNIQTDLTENITEAAIHNFIGDRAKHKDYKEYLGIVSTIRKDFETLSELFSESNEDNKEADNKDELQKRKDKILNEERGFIKEQFKDGKKLDRIILYIDDLDRCSDEKVLEIIQAVHLIMAFPLFNVVVGVDRRCVENALIYKNLLQYTQYASLDEIEEAGIHVITPDEYLEKIFQIPFQLDDPSEGSIKGMVNSLLKNQIEKEVVEDKKPQPEVLPEKEKPSIDDIIAEFVDEEKTDEAINEELGIPAEEIVEKPQQRTITPKDLELSKTELSLLKEMAWLVGSIPRTIKRFINIYRIIRAHQNLNLDDNKKREEYLVIMFILAIHIGQYKKFAPKLMELIVDSEINLKEAFDKFNTSLIVQKDIAKIKNAVFEIRHKLETTEAIKELLQFNGTKFSKHIQLVGRFSFGSVENGINND